MVRNSKPISLPRPCIQTLPLPPSHWHHRFLVKPLSYHYESPVRPLNRKKQNWSGQQTEGERLVVIDAISGLKYSKTLIKAKTGEALALKLNNNDAMPHNLVIVAKESAQKVGDASFKMLSDPKAGEKNYAPDLSEVLHVIPVINPGETHTLHFRTPETPGDYPFICTFPGHWMAMQGILKVE